jgi:hypothetical protein
MSENNEISPVVNKKIFSFGFRCSSAAILKRMGLKQESYPFDWLVSHLSVIKHCIENNFEEFLNINNYKRKYTNTYEMADSRNGFICDEHLMVNVFYQPQDMLDVENTYKCRLAMNHHNITEPEDTSYYNRCVSRFRELVISDEQKIYLHIRPVIRLEMYQENKKEIIRELVEFDNYVHTTMNQKCQGLIFIIVRDDNPDYQFRTETLYSSFNGTTIYLIYANSGFIDAGEMFMGNYYEEKLFIESKIRETLEL